MASYAIASVQQKIDEITVSPSNHLPILNLKCLYDDLGYFESFLSYLRANKFVAKDMEQQIEDVVHKIEDLIGSRISSFENLLEIVLEITSLNHKLKNRDFEKEVDPPPLRFLATDDDNALFGRYDSILGSCSNPVGLDDEIKLLKYRVMRGSSKLKNTVVFGMAGCGKTTLVRKVYSELLCHFDFHFILTVAINYTLQQILVCILNTLGFHFDDETNEMMGVSELGMSLMNLLNGKRYLCVLDNLWEYNTWEQLKMFFPDECNGSRIIYTTRVIGGGRGIEESHHKCLLGYDDSWELLRDVIFTSKEFCNPQLEEIGRKIARKCEGLPLAIISMGKLMRDYEKTIDKWKEVLEDDDPFQIKKYDYQPISKSLYLSYDPLPYHLKLCFLFMGVLPQNYIIKPSTLIKLWIAEGFITPIEDESIQDTAKEYLQELYAKSMVLFRRSRVGYKTIIGTYKVHFVFRSLCIKEVQDEKFCLVINKYIKIFEQGTDLQRRLCIHNNIVMGFKENNSMDSISGVSSVLYCGPRYHYLFRVCLNFKDLKILHALNIRFYEFPLEVLELFRLKFLSLTYSGQLPKSISKLWKLEFLILDTYHRIKSAHGGSYLPKEIWNLQWLKCIQCTGLDLASPCSELVLKYLVELSGVSACSCKPNILSRMQNLKKLEVHIELMEDEVETFSFLYDVARYLNCLSKFKCEVLQVFSYPIVPLVPIFPTTITKLSLNGCGFPWKYMSAISVLPNLTKLKLQEYAFYGPVWEVCEGGFPMLQKLVMKDLNIEEWRAESDQFPALKWLEIHDCYNLQEVPIEFADLPNLVRMHLHSNGVSLEKSARKILQRQQLQRDERLTLHISTLGNNIASRIAMPQDDFFFSTMLDPEDS